MNASVDKPPNASRASYQKRMHKVLDHIDRQLDQELNLERLAAIAHFSPFHFHRLFTAWVGETPGDYLRRRRLEVAAFKLASQPHLAVLDLALAVGFSSGEAFSRAFKLQFGSAPTIWRTDFRRKHYRNLDQALPQLQQHNSVSINTTNEPTMSIPMNVTIMQRAPVLVAYLRHTGPYGMPITQFWRNTFYPWLESHQLLDQPCYGIGHDNPDITEPSQCRYDACVELPPHFAVPRDMLTATIPGGRYAVLAFKGSVPEIGDAWKALIREWLPSSGMQFDARPCFEVYPVERVDPQTGIFRCDICIPVKDLL